MEKNIFLLSLVLCVPFKKMHWVDEKLQNFRPKFVKKLQCFPVTFELFFLHLKNKIFSNIKPKNLFQVECSEEPLSHELTNPPEAIREEVVEMTEDIKNNEENQEAEKLVLNDETAKDSATASISSSSASRSSSPSLEESKEDESPEEEEEESSVEASK